MFDGRGRTGSPALSRLGNRLSAMVVVGTALALVSTPSAAAAAQASVERVAAEDPAWVSEYRSPYDIFDNANAVTVNQQGTIVYVAGTSMKVPPGLVDQDSEVMVVAYERATGEQLWTSISDHSLFYEFFQGFAWSPDGSTLYTLTNYGGGDLSGGSAFRALDPMTGETRREHIESGFGGYFVLSPDGSTVYTCGATREGVPNNNGVIRTRAYDLADFSLLWEGRSEPSAGTNKGAFCSGVRVTPDGSKVVSSGCVGYFDLAAQRGCVYRTTAYAAATGQKLWEESYAPYAIDSIHYPVDIEMAPDGSTVFVTGHIWDGVNAKYGTVAYNTNTGNMDWERQFDTGRLQDRPNDMEVSPDGSRVFVTGYADYDGNSPTDKDAQTIAIDSETGDLLWAASYNGPDNAKDEGKSIALSPDSSTVVVTGWVNGDGIAEPQADIVTVGYDAASGDKKFDYIYDGHGLRDRGAAVEFTPDGTQMVVGGLSQGEDGQRTPSRMVTLAYTLGQAPPPPPGVSQDVVATVPDEPGQGSLVISVDPDDRVVTMPPLALAASGDRLVSSGGLRPVIVTDTRTDTNPGWDASAQAGEFSSGAASFRGGFLGWSPQVVSESAGQDVAAGGVVAPGFPSGDGVSVPRTLASAQAGAGVGTAELGAGLRLEIPVDTPPGTYTAVLTLTAI